jgi:DNA-(apurinic or apyrimidinic site) lyase
MKNADKTMTFAIKMFGYGARVVFDKFVKYPMNIKIPVDSRIMKI